MPSLLHLDSSAHRSPESVSRALTAEFADRWRAHHPGGGYRYRDLAAEPVPPLASGFCALGRRLERHATPPPVTELISGDEERREWELTRALVDEIRNADTVLVGAPMYNFTVSATLKAWIDRVCFPGELTDLRGTTVVVVATRGGGYGPGTPREAWDFQVPYLRALAAAHGVAEHDLHVVTAELTMAAVAPHLAGLREAAEASLAAARAELTALVRRDGHAEIDGSLVRS